MSFSRVERRYASNSGHWQKSVCISYPPIFQQTFTEHREGGGGKEYKEGESWSEGKQTTHWVENKGTKQLVVIVADIFKP